MFSCALGLPPVQCTNFLHVARKEKIKIGNHVLNKWRKSGKKSEEKEKERCKVSCPISH